MQPIQVKFNGGFIFRHLDKVHYNGQDVGGGGGTGDGDIRVNAIIQDPNSPNDGIVQLVDLDGNVTQISVVGIYATSSVNADQGLIVESVNGVDFVRWGGNMTEDRLLEQGNFVKTRLDAHDLYLRTGRGGQVELLRINMEESFMRKRGKTWNSNALAHFGDPITLNPTAYEIAGEFTMTEDILVSGRERKYIQVTFGDLTAQAEILFFRNSLARRQGNPIDLINSHRMNITMALDTVDNRVLTNMEVGNPWKMFKTAGDPFTSMVTNKLNFNDDQYDYLVEYDTTDGLRFMFSPDNNADLSGCTVVVRTYSILGGVPTVVSDISIVLIDPAA